MSEWLTIHWPELVESLCATGGLIFTALTIRKDERSRRIANLIAVNARYSQIWEEFGSDPTLHRILESKVNLAGYPITERERLFVRKLILHLDMVQRAACAGLFVKVEELQKDIHDFFSLPIPQSIWNSLKSYQEGALVKLVDSAIWTVKQAA